MAKDGSSMLSGVIGALGGGLLTWTFIHYDFELPWFLKFGDKVEEVVATTVAEDALFDPDLDEGKRTKALETWLAKNPGRLVELEGDNGQRLMELIQREEAFRRAQRILTAAKARAAHLDSPAVADSAARNYGSTEPELVRRRAVEEALSKDAFLRFYLAHRYGADRDPAEYVLRLTELDRFRRDLADAPP
jgi:hypothetical protein